jgi:pimeloyl-ACP methyl ester carboxylesterase
MSGVQPTVIHDGLACYQRGTGPAVLLLPYPHASDGEPIIDSALAGLTATCGMQVFTFDPPGLYRSTRPARVSLEEKVGCAAETLDILALPTPVAVMGHSMSALCAFFFTLAHPDPVSRLVLISAPPGSGLAIVRYRAMPFHWPPWNPDPWRMLSYRILFATGRGSLATHKKLDLLQERANVVDQSLVTPIVIEPRDRHRAAPARDRWWLAIRHVHVMPRASDLRCPTLLAVGQHDPQTPARVSRALHRRIPDSRLAVFEHSGHSRSWRSRNASPRS